MRIAVAGLLLLAAMGQAVAASSTPGISPEEAHAGCYHTDLRPCMISLGSAFWFDMDFVAPLIARRNELDVNGRTAHRDLTFSIRQPGDPVPVRITLILGAPAPNDQVVKIRIDLADNPDTAHTASEYDETQLYAVVSVVLGKACPSLDRLALYRFYENNIKPKKVVKYDTRKYGIFHHTKETIDTEKMPFCGAMFSLHGEYEFDGTPDMPNRKPIGRTFIDIE
jgi:hypothetical protein